MELFFKKRLMGRARRRRELLPRLCDFWPDLQLARFIDGPLPSALLEHVGISIRRAPAVRRLLAVRGAVGGLLFPLRQALGRGWNRQGSRWLSDLLDAAWLSADYPPPPKGWRGRQAVFLYDLIHEGFPEIFTAPQDEAGRRQKAACLQTADAIVCISETTRRDAAQRFPDLEARMVAAPLACSPMFRPLTPGEMEQVTPPPFLSAGAPLVLFVGARTHYKNFLLLFAALGDWPSGETQPHLLCIGPEWSQAERAMINFSAGRGRVHTLADVDDESLRWWYNRADVFVYPSLAEGFGIPLLEALVCGCPLAASDIPVFHEVAGDAADYFDPEDPADIQRVLHQVLAAGRDAPRQARGVAQAQRYSWEKTAQQVATVLKRLAD